MPNTNVTATDLVWNPRVKNARGTRGALVGTLCGVPVTGRTHGRAVAFQLQLTTGQVHTVFWDGTLHFGAPCLFDLDTGVALPHWNPEFAFAWFDLLDNVVAELAAAQG